jgi:hypothetical protein
MIRVFWVLSNQRRRETDKKTAHLKADRSCKGPCQGISQPFQRQGSGLEATQWPLVLWRVPLRSKLSISKESGITAFLIWHWLSNFLLPPYPSQQVEITCCEKPKSSLPSPLWLLFELRASCLWCR